MNFTHLLAFYEVARAGSISAGAERLHVSQPAVTREIRELEDRLGMMLFDRLPRGVALTEGGKLLYEYASRIFTLADAAGKELAELAGLGSGHMKIGASGTLGVYFVPDAIARFNVRHPHVAIDLTVTNTERVEAGLRDLTFTIGFIEGPFDDSILHARRIGSDEIAVIAAPGHPCAGKKLRARELVDQAVIMREPGSGTRAIIEESYRRAGLDIEPLMSVSDTEAIKRMLLSQHALAYISTLSVTEELRRGELTIIEVEDLHIVRPLHMVWAKGRSLSPSSQALFDLVASGTLDATAAEADAVGASEAVGPESARSLRQSRR
ncbi:LysR family transcriptional regulator [Paraburkholderia kururiensis]|uniref:LysR family transcriptional regulator n=1 Tax=Paraburkholderia kururiensis TaxID=984307 RepID=A0ABZ0WLT9_9BURK|nr:LysR family transcriptional regulator [Paraburkholderia kururiensis]WQD78315.1 LysR family transcriptional regulator [Paraburkholderia kururiensis]